MGRDFKVRPSVNGVDVALIGEGSLDSAQPYTYDDSSTTTGVDPGDGNFRFDSAILGSAFAISISVISALDQDVQSWLDNIPIDGIPTSTITFRSKTDPLKWAQYHILDSENTETGWYNLTVSPAAFGDSIAGTPVGDILVSFVRDGLPGDSADIASETHGTGSKSTPVNADELPLVDTEDSNSLKKLTLTNLKAFLKTYFDTLYPSGSGTSTGTNTGDQTSVTGNAGTATALQNSRNIDGQAFNGTANITVIAPGTHAASSKGTPVDADELPLVDSAASNVLKRLTWANLKATLKTYFDTLYPSGSGTSTGTNTGDQTSVTGNAGTATQLQNSRNIDGQAFNGTADITVIAPGTHAATSKGTPVNADELPLVDTEASNVLKRLTLTNLKAFLKTYFDTLYLGISSNATSASTLSPGRTIDGQSFDGSANITVIAPGTHAATSKGTPVNADEIPLVDTEASNVLKRLTLTNFKAFLKTYFDTLYLGISSNASSASVLSPGRNIDGQAFTGSADITVIAPGTHAATSKATPVDADELPLVDSAASNVLKRLTWANLKATLKTYLDTLYVAQLSAKSLTTRPAIANTETVVISYTCAANELVAGTTFRFKAFATRAGTNSSSQVIRIRVGTTTLTGNIAATLTPPAAAVASPIEIEGLVTVVTAGAGGTIRGSLRCLTHLAAVTVSPAIAATAAVGVNTTTANMLIELTFISGNASNTYTFENVTLEKVVA